MLAEATGRRQHFLARGQVFSLCGPSLSRQTTCLCFFSFSKLVLQITNGFVHSTVPLNRPACRLLMIGSYRKRLDRSRASD